MVSNWILARLEHLLRRRLDYLHNRDLPMYVLLLCIPHLLIIWIALDSLVNNDLLREKETQAHISNRVQRMGTGNYGSYARYKEYEVSENYP